MKAFQAVALELVDRHLRENLAAAPVGDNVLRRFEDRHFIQGWSLPMLDEVSEGVPFALFVDRDFPYSLPRVSALTNDLVLAWPHAEADGVLCCEPPQATGASTAPIPVVEEVLADAVRLITECTKGDLEGDFEEEFISYWAIAASGRETRIVSLLDPTPESRAVWVWKGRQGTRRLRVLADDADALVRWVQRTWDSQDPEVTRCGYLAWMPKLLAPHDYPDKGLDAYQLIAALGESPRRSLESMVREPHDELVVILAANGRYGVGMGGLLMRRPNSAVLEKGFRPGRVPERHYLPRWLSPVRRVEKVGVERADHGWIHGRDHDPRQELLRTARVAVIGCGSLGAETAVLLARSGVANIECVDGEVLDWPNTARHALGADAVRRNKAAALVSKLERELPHLGDLIAHQNHLSLRSDELFERLAACDCIVVSTGTWPVECLINDVQHERPGFPPIVFTWLEPRAAAAHAVATFGGRGCLRCGFEPGGRPLAPATVWPDEDGSRPIPACGGVFSPYGAAALAWGHALAATLTLDVLLGTVCQSTQRTWLGSRRSLESQGGEWSDHSRRLMGQSADGSVMVEREWPIRVNCPLCAA